MSKSQSDPASTQVEVQRRIQQAAKNEQTELDLARLGLTSVPPEIGQLTKLTTLVLSYNQLTSVPPQIGQLTKLTELYLHKNQLTSVPPEIGQLTKLTELSLDYNQLTSVPPEIGQLTKLRRLDLYNNKLTSIPPESLRRLSKLEGLFLHGNPRLNLPASVLGVTFEKWNRDPATAPKPGPILDYYIRTRQPAERRPLREGKLILVGRGDVGKTSLVRRLVENKFSRREDTTQGIRIRQWDVAVRKNETIRMHVWDFGGQEIMHATHQLFLTDRSLYLLILDGRAGQQEAEADYWLRLIASFAPESPVLVVLNKIKKDHFDLNRGALREKFPQVQGFLETDCDNPGRDKKPGKHGYGIEPLRKSIAQQINKLPDIRQPFPVSWFAIKEELSKPRRKNFLTLDEYRELCNELGETNAESQSNLSLFLHRLGIALNFSDDPRLHDKHVLNPHWLTTGIYKLLNSERLAKRKGELRPSDLKAELDAKKYPPEMHGFLLNLMEKFELCFNFQDGERYLIPELLDEQQPDAALEFTATQCLNFHYRYPVLPPGLLPRFIVRTHVLSEQHRWRTGVILNFEGNTALVKADPQDKTIRVLINGPIASRRRMLAMIRQDFDVIHRDIPHLNPDELVSFPDHPEVTEKYSDLEVRFSTKSDAVIERVVGNEVISHSVRELLEGVELAPLISAAKPGSRTRRQAELAFGKGLAPDAGEPLRLFYSYSRLDSKQRLKLAKYLSPLVRSGLIRGWHDSDILPGAEWEPTILDELKQSDMVLLLISPNFVASDYCFEKELPIALEMHEQGRACVLPVILETTVRWQDLPSGKFKLGQLNALPTSGKPLPRWRRNDGWADVAAGIERAAVAFRGKRPNAR
ncbi:MAG: leucine-rich repeat domain-containing protein [Planctomycetaceae bacterium]|nr:leucine-rich repeat domain-containing protein [Planctomycetaceae bacterium]